MDLKDADVCQKCYWAHPENYEHIAMRPVRRVDLMWSGGEVSVYDRLKAKTQTLQKDIPSFVKEIIERNV